MKQLRSIFISDIHLGTLDSRSEYLLEFLRATDCEHIFLLGDVLDLWKMRSGWHWPQLNNNLFHLLCAKAARGTRVVYIPGNHDMLLRDYAGTTFFGLEFHNEFVHTTADGRRMLLLHGDEFDGAVKYNTLLSALGNHAYDLLLWLNRGFNHLRRWSGRSYWSLSGYLKKQSRNARIYVERFEEVAIREARRRGLDGILCGHIHQASLRVTDSVTYGNTGDWVESCTALAEDHTGALRIIQWEGEAKRLYDHKLIRKAA